MKKTFAFILSLFVFLYAASAMADDIDISSLTLDELIELQGKITSRINEEFSASSDVIYIGEYVGGIDIKVGRYLFTALKGESDFHMYLYADADTKNNYDWLLNQALRSGDICEIEIKEGMILEVSSGSAMVTPHAKPSWAP